MNLAVTVDDMRVQRSLARMSARMSDQRPVFRVVAEDFHRMEERLFASHGGSAGQPWVGSRSGRPVTMTGPRSLMKRSLTVPRARSSVQRITRNRLTVGSRHPLVHLHQDGTRERWVKTYKGKPLAKPRYAGALPRRVVVAVTDADARRWTALIRDHVMLGLQPLGL